MKLHLTKSKNVVFHLSYVSILFEIISRALRCAQLLWFWRPEDHIYRQYWHLTLEPWRWWTVCKCKLSVKQSFMLFFKSKLIPQTFTRSKHITDVANIILFRLHKYVLLIRASRFKNNHKECSDNMKTSYCLLFNVDYAYYAFSTTALCNISFL